MSDLSRPDPDPAWLLAARAGTPARILVGRAGASYRTETLLQLREDHAAALDAVRSDLRLDPAFVAAWDLFEVASRARTKAEYLARPDLGRSLTAGAIDRIRAECPAGADLHVFLADGLSSAAVEAQAPSLLPLLKAEADARGWRFGRPFVVRHGRVGLLNDVGSTLGPTVAVLLIGERPGLATAESLSAYLAYRPAPGQTDADRNLISNIHPRGVPVDQAARRVADLAARMIRLGLGGVGVKEAWSDSDPSALGDDRSESG